MKTSEVHLKPGSFGSGHFLNLVEKDIDNLEGRDLARSLGWAAGCPVVERLTDPENTTPGRGPNAMIERYGEVSFWFVHLTDMLEEMNPELAETFSTGAKRELDDVERMIAYDETSIPEDYFDRMEPLGTLAGYALPRVMIEELKYASQDPNRDDVQARLVKALEAFEVSARNTSSPSELVAKFSEAVTAMDAYSERVLSHVLAPGWVNEHGATWMYQDMKDALKKHAPNLWRQYES